MAERDVIMNKKRLARELVVMVRTAGLASLVAWIASAIYVDRKLHSVTSNYKFGPMRHLAYYSTIAHKANRMLGDAALETWTKAQEEDAEYYRRIEDEHDRLLANAKKNGTWDKPRVNNWKVSMTPMDR